jgi:hypothetical protein
LIFDEETMTITLNTEAAISLLTGKYKARMTLSDVTGKEKEYEILFEAECWVDLETSDQGLDFYNSEIPDPPKPIFASANRFG